MRKQKDRIYILEWLELKPYTKQVVTDSFYLNLCNEVKHAITSCETSFALLMYLNKSEINTLSIFLTSYFEDLVSGSNVWNTFIRCHTKLYNKSLPFYNTENYIEKEINMQDVRFLIWYFLNTIQNEKFISPFNGFMVEMAEKVMEVFESNWEYAPENESLQKHYTIDEKESDYYDARQLIDTILFKTYLFYPDTAVDLQDAELEIMENLKEEENINSLMTYLNYNRDNFLYIARTRLLNFKGQEWVAEILGKDHPLHDDYLNVSKKISGLFLYTGQDNKYAFIEHIASGKKFNLVKESFEQQLKSVDVKSILFMGIALWQNEWWFTGISSQQSYNAGLVEEEKNSAESKRAVNFLDHQQYKAEEVIENQFAAFKDYTNGRQIVFIESNKIDDFLKGYTEHYNAYIQFSKKEIERAGKKAKKTGYPLEKFSSKEFTKNAENGLIFFNPKSGIEIALDVNSAFPSPDNPFFDAQNSEEHILDLFLAEDMSTELSMYCIDNYKDTLPFFTEGDGEIYLNDIDFLLRFWKKNNYFSVPQITFTGQQ